MSQENVEVVRRLMDHWERGDWRGGRELFANDCEIVFSTSWFPDAGTYKVGWEAVRAWTDFTDAWEEFEVGVDQIVDAGEYVVALVRNRGRGRASGADVDAEVGGVFTVRDGKIVRADLTDRQRALEAAGLRE
jgi:ketosteroid isomerase-like protein